MGTIEEPRIVQRLSKLVEAGEERRKRECAKAAAAFKSALEAFRDSYPARALPDKPAINDNETTSTHALKFYRDIVEPPLSVVVHLLEDKLQLIDFRAHAAECLLVIATEFAWASEFTVAEEIAREAITLAEGTAVAGYIQRELAKLQELAKMHRLNAATAAVDVAVAVLRQRFATIAHTFAGRIVAREGYARDNQLVCREELAYFRSEIEPAFLDLLRRLQPYDQVVTNLREQAAGCLAGIASDHTWADEFLAAERLMEESLTLAQGTWAASSIHKKYLSMRKNAYTERSNTRWRPVSFGSVITMTCLLVAAVTAVFSMLAMKKTASTSGARPMQMESTPSGVSIPLPQTTDAQANPNEQTVSTKGLTVLSPADVEEPLEASIQRLQNEIQSLKRKRAAGAAVDSELLNVKLYQYSSLVKKRRRLIEIPNQQDGTPNK